MCFRDNTSAIGSTSSNFFPLDTIYLGFQGGWPARIYGESPLSVRNLSRKAIFAKTDRGIGKL
jgi:hypothetical protein